MIEFLKVFLYKLRFLVAGVFIFICLLFLTLLSSVLINQTVHAQAADSGGNESDAATEDSPNVITRGMFRTVDKLSHTVDSSGAALSNSLNSIGESTSALAAKSGKFVVSNAASGASLAGHAVGSGFSFVAHSTGSVISSIADMPLVSDVIRPADKTAIPIINTNEVLAQSLTASTTGKNDPQASQVTDAAAWPIHGLITEEFGVPHWPFQPLHTGIDISDGQPPGVTPIHPFKAGKVKDVVHSSTGLGNHVIIDHGGGIVSVYGHLAATSVQPGQQVNKDTVLGYQGSTGASTGTHLHFEIDLNGQPVNPHNYVSGQP
jgi:murein DD-endopeptidase MepM/ murein hydrolase activator NlpD